jgi:hypothetical protein
MPTSFLFIQLTITVNTWRWQYSLIRSTVVHSHQICHSSFISKIKIFLLIFCKIFIHIFLLFFLKLLLFYLIFILNLKGLSLLYFFLSLFHLFSIELSLYILIYSFKIFTLFLFFNMFLLWFIVCNFNVVRQNIV